MSREPQWGSAFRSVSAMIDDLEQQAEGLALAERDVEVADRAEAEFAQVALASRLHAQVGRQLHVTSVGGQDTAGEVVRTGADWLLMVDDHGREWLLPHRGLVRIAGSSPRSVPDAALGVAKRLGMRSVLRQFARHDLELLVHLGDGRAWEGRFLRIGADFVEGRRSGPVADAGMDLLPFVGLASVVRRR